MTTLTPTLRTDVAMVMAVRFFTPGPQCVVAGYSRRRGTRTAGRRDEARPTRLCHVLPSGGACAAPRDRFRPPNPTMRPRHGPHGVRPCPPARRLPNQRGLLPPPASDAITRCAARGEGSPTSQVAGGLDDE